MEFSQIAILLVAASLFGLVSKKLKQPLLVGYLFAGLIFTLLGVVGDPESFDGLAQIGVTLLLFLVGLEMDLKEIATIGKTALLTGVGQILFTSAIGFSLALLFGFSTLAALYIAIALTFSSTIIMVKLLGEKQDLDSLYGKISIGFLLVQDFVAVAILMFLAGLSHGGLSATQYAFLIVKAIGLFAAVWFLSKSVLPKLFDKLVADSTELLFVVSIAWALGVATFVAGPLGFSLEIGGFLAGLALSNMPEHLEVASRTRPLRDFFLVIFFFTLGTKLVVGSVASVLPTAILLSLFVLVGNPLIVMAIMGALGYKKRTSFMAGLTVAQISEFSLIIASMGLSLGHLSEETVAMIVLVGIITMTISTYMILGAEKIYKHIAKYLGIFERKHTTETILASKQQLSDHVVLIGCDRTGRALLPYFKSKDFSVLVIDHNPKVFNKLSSQKLPILFGDVSDIEILDAANFKGAKIVVSTITNFSDNMFLLSYLNRHKVSAITVFKTKNKKDAVKLYEAGADYVIVPDVVAGEHIRHIMESHGIGKKKMQQLGGAHFRRLLEST